jgi:hypothetical protein
MGVEMRCCSCMAGALRGGIDVAGRKILGGSGLLIWKMEKESTGREM